MWDLFFRFIYILELVLKLKDSLNKGFFILNFGLCILYNIVFIVLCCFILILLLIDDIFERKVEILK